MLQLFSQCRIWVHLIRIRSREWTNPTGRYHERTNLKRSWSKPSSVAWRQARQAATTLLFWRRRLARLLIGWRRLARLRIGWLRLMPLLNPRWILLGLLWFRHNGGTRPGNHGSAV